MKTAIIISEGVKQIMFTPENDTEKQALKMFTPDDDIKMEVKQGSFHSGLSPQGYRVQMCMGGYLRAWDSEDSLMLVLTPRSQESETESIDG